MIKASRKISLGLAILICCIVPTYAGGKFTAKGRIAAYRLGDRALQTASFVENREIFLFKVDGTRETILKLVYIHQGYSDLKEDILSGAKQIVISTHRNTSCDQTLDMFERDAPVIPAQEDRSGSLNGRIIFTEKQAQSLPKSYHLKCYTLDHWEVNGQ